MFRSDNTTLEGAADFVELIGNYTEDRSFSLDNVTTDPGYPWDYKYFYFFDYEAWYNQFRFKLELFLWTKLTLVLAIVCILGNVLIIIVLTQKTSRIFSTSIFICSLAFSDMFISIYLLEGFLISNGYIVKAYHEVDCLFRLFLPRAGSRASSMMLAVISIERAVSVKIPHKVKLIFTVKAARLIVTAVWFIAISTTGLTTYVYTYVIFRDTPQCLIDQTNKRIAYRVNFFIGKTLLIGAWIVNLVCMIYIIKALTKNVVGKDKSNKKRIKSVTKTLLIVNIVYFLCVTPDLCYNTYIFVLRNVIYVRWSFIEYSNHFNANNIMILIGYCNNVSNFFIYFLSGSKFRSETKDYFLSCLRKTKTQN
ncbi:melanocyte-stimulating hormone receptor-like [Mercenaria mercenaria]|uniref:melanocyte-stimulating hormone receptor-like n=1 Tax=Mercenaria mercenaria TaxID=6596 RepID=UPI00234E4B97|nr:melanocyte-stimulating hormone receptor-like [Mercenaria mercenaria]